MSAKRNNLSFFIILFIVPFLVSIPAIRANSDLINIDEPITQEVDEKWPYTETVCDVNGENCEDKITPKSAFNAYKYLRNNTLEKGGVAPSTAFAITAGLTTAGAIAWASGAYIQSKYEIRAAAIVTGQIDREARILTQGLEKVFRPAFEKLLASKFENIFDEKQLYNILFQDLYPEGKKTLTEALENVVKNSQTRSNLRVALTKAFGNRPEWAERVVSGLGNTQNRNWIHLAFDNFFKNEWREMHDVWSLKTLNKGSAAIELKMAGKKMGEFISKRLSEEILVSFRSTFVAAAKFKTKSIVTAATVGRCVRKSGKIVTIAAAPLLAALLDVALSPDEAEAATLSGYFAQNPVEFIEGKRIYIDGSVHKFGEQEALFLLKSDRNLRESVVKAATLVQMSKQENLVDSFTEAVY